MESIELQADEVENHIASIALQPVTAKPEPIGAYCNEPNASMLANQAQLVSL